jgi:hypothetical protein
MNRTRWLLSFGLVLLGIALAGCANPARPASNSIETSNSAQISREELRDRLAQFEDKLEATIARACDQLVEASPDRRTRKLTLLWQMRSFPLSRKAITQANPVQGLLDAWALRVRLVNYVETGDGGNLFAPNQQIVITAARELEGDIERLAALIMNEQMLAEAQQRIHKLAAAHPLRGDFSGTAMRTYQDEDKKDAVLASIAALPLAPFKAFEGLDKGAAAIRGFTVVAARLTEVVEGLANDARLQIELLLLEAEDLGAIKSALTSLDRLSRSSERLANVAETLPQDVRRELVEAFNSIDARQDGVQSTLKNAKATAEQIQLASERLTAAGNAWEGTAKAIADMTLAFRSSPTASAPGAPKGPEGRPFDILDYAKAADSYYAAARELSALADEIRALSESNQLTIRAAEASSTVGSVTDHVAWRAAQLIVLIFVLAVVFRLTRRKMST